MLKKDRNIIIEEIAKMNDDEIQNYYLDCLDDSIGTLVDRMIENEYDMVDIKERIKFENFLREKSDLVLDFCNARGLDPMEKYHP